MVLKLNNIKIVNICGYFDEYGNTIQALTLFLLRLTRFFNSAGTEKILQATTSDNV